jgi:hypothetical protein
VHYACRKLLKQSQTGPTRHVIILLSDGDDKSSSVTREQAIEMAQRAEVSVYTISTSLTRSGGRGQKNLKSIDRRPVYGGTEKFQTDPQWKDYILFFEYFHGDNGAGLGATHQTGWTGLVGKLIELFGRLDGQQLLDAGRSAAFAKERTEELAVAGR